MAIPAPHEVRRARIAAELQALLTRWATDSRPERASVSLDLTEQGADLYLGIEGVRDGQLVLLADAADFDRLIAIATTGEP